VLLLSGRTHQKSAEINSTAAANLHIDGAHFSISKESDQLAIASIKT
jgi:hypothetical protein